MPNKLYAQFVRPRAEAASYGVDAFVDQQKQNNDELTYHVPEGP
jgi:hypothetical protein